LAEKFLAEMEFLKIYPWLYVKEPKELVIAALAAWYSGHPIGLNKQNIRVQIPAGC
jgi:hypothetical protein